MRIQVNIRAVPLFIALILLPGVAMPETHCPAPAERQILDSLFNMAFDRAEALTETLDEQSGVIPSRGFYTALIEWARFQHKGIGPGNPGISRLKEEVRALENRHERLGTPDSELAWSLAAAHASRILLNEERFIGAYNLGYPAVKRLMRLVQQEFSNAEAKFAAQLAIGIYNVYINNLPEGLKWASFLLMKPGDAEQGRWLIEQALANSKTLSPEAGRVLLLEFPWSLPGHCDYLELASHMTEQYPNNPDFSLARQGLLLRCGYPDEAALENRKFLVGAGSDEISGFNPIDYDLQFKLGNARVMAETGDYENLENEVSNLKELDYYYTLAKAHAYDIVGQRESAISHYHVIMDNDDAPDALKKSAEMRLTFPYTETKSVLPGRKVFIQHCL